MSSWTDLPTNFNPYIQQLPVESMISVGVEKQRRYDEGVQKIQSAIDRVAGLDIVRDIDKQYLKSKLEQLGGDLKTVAASDFSRYQLTNQVAGMATKIGKDPNIITAVSSTAFYKKQLQNMQKDITEGKANPANNYRFNRRANEWLLSTELGKSFGTNYLPPINVWEKVKDIAKEVGVDSSDLMQLYQTDEQGKIITKKNPKTGIEEAQWNPVMAEKILKGKDAGKILNAFQAALTPADYEQLNIEGEYQLANHTPEMLKNKLTQESQFQITNNNEKILTLKSELYKENTKNGKEKDQERIDSLNKQIEYYEKSSKNLQNSLEKGLAAVDINPDVVRGSIYTNNYLTNLASSLSSQEVATKYSKSPMWDITMEQNRLNFDIQKENQRHAEWLATFGLSKDEFSLKKWIAEKEHGIIDQPVKEPIDASNLLSIKTNVENRHKEAVDKMNSLAYDITLDKYKRGFPKNEGETDAQYDLRLRNQILSEATRNDLTLPEYVNREAVGELNNPNVLAFEKDRLGDYKTTVESAELQGRRIKEAKEKARTNAINQGLNIPTDQEIKKNLQPTSVTYSLGNNPFNIMEQKKTQHLTSDDLLDIIYANPEVLNDLGPITVDKEQAVRRDAAKQRLENKFGKEDAAEISKQVLGRNDPLIGFKLGVGVNPTPIWNAIKMMRETQYEKLGELEAQEYINSGVIQQPLSHAVYQGKMSDQDWQSKVINVVQSYAPLKVEEMEKALAAKGNKAVRVTEFPGVGSSPSTYHLQVREESGWVNFLEIDSDNFKILTGKTPRISMDKPDIIDLLETKGNTNYTGMLDPAGAKYGFDDFPSFKDDEYNIKGDLFVNKGINSNAAWIYLYVYDKKGNYITTVQYPRTEDKAALINIYNEDRTYNPLLYNKGFLRGINSTVVRYLMGEQ